MQQTRKHPDDNDEKLCKVFRVITNGENIYVNIPPYKSRYEIIFLYVNFSW